MPRSSPRMSGLTAARAGTVLLVTSLFGGSVSCSTANQGAPPNDVGAAGAHAEPLGGSGGSSVNQGGLAGCELVGGCGASGVGGAASAAGAWGVAGGAGDGPQPQRPKVPPFDWVGIIGTGQSLAVGGGGTEQQRPISTVASYSNLKLLDSGPDPKYPAMPGVGSPVWSAVPLNEPIRKNVAGQGPGYSDWQYPNNIQGETPHSAMASTLSASFAAQGGEGQYVTVHSVVGWAGRCLDNIDKQGPGRAFPASLNETRVWKQLADAAGKSYGVGAVILTHGECDANNASYASGLHQLWSDYDADIKAVTGQDSDVVVIASQQSANASGANGSAVQLWRASLEHPGQILCAGPKYQYQYGPDRLHMPATGYVRLGEKYAEIFDIVVNQQRAWKPLQPNKVSRSGATVTVDFDVPNPPLVWDERLAAPHQQAHSYWAAGKGFEVKSQNGSALTIASVEIQGSSVVIELAADPGAAKVTVGYALTQDGAGTQAGTASGLRGLLRDSDDFVGADVEDIQLDVTQGSDTITSAEPGGFVRRTALDWMTGAGVPTGTALLSRESNDQAKLTAPWTGPSARITATLRHDQSNFCVHFAMAEGD